MRHPFGRLRAGSERAKRVEDLLRSAAFLG